MFSNSSRRTVKRGVFRTYFCDKLCCAGVNRYSVEMNKQKVCRYVWDSCVFSQRMAITRIFICVSANLCSVCKQYSEVVDKSNDLFLTLSQTTLTKSRF